VGPRKEKNLAMPEMEPGPSSPQPVAITTELFRPRIIIIIVMIRITPSVPVEWVAFLLPYSGGPKSKSLPSYPN
jgi:hypothetical protein